MDYTLILFSIHPEELPVIQAGLGDIPITYFDGTGYSSYSKVVNAAIESAPTEVVILMTDKARPSPADVYKTLDLINQGYGFVGLHEFRFFGFKKQLFRQIGLFDEGYITGGYEDTDLKYRMIENDISFYLTNECPAVIRPSHWNYEGSRAYWESKWKVVYYDQSSYIKTLVRLKPEPTTNYDLGPDVPTEFLPYTTHSVTNLEDVHQITQSAVVTPDQITIYVLSDFIDEYHSIKSKLLENTNIEYFDTTKVSSFSEAINTCVSRSHTDRIIFITGQVIPKDSDITFIHNNLKNNHALVSVSGFRIFGVNKIAFKSIGAFDEKFMGYGFSGDDFLVRLVLANLSFIAITGVAETKMPTSNIEKVNVNDSVYWSKKWQFNDPVVVAESRKVISNYCFDTNFNIELLDFYQNTYSNVTHFGILVRKIIR